VDENDLRVEVTDLLRRLVACDTSNPPGNEVQAAAVIEDFLGSTLRCERVAKDPDRPNLVATLPGRGEGPSLAFLGHLDVVQATRQDWSVEPFAAVEREDAIWGRGTIDMKCQVAATTVALRTLSRQGFEPAGDLMLILTADEEVGDAGVGAPHLVAERSALCPDYVVGEGAGERFESPGGPLYLLDTGVKATAPVTMCVHGRAADSSLPGVGSDAITEASRLLARLNEHRFPVRILPEVEPLIDTLAGTDGTPEERVERARKVHPALDELVGALTAAVVRPTVLEANGPANVIAERVEVKLQCLVLPGVTKAEIEAELCEALGPGDYKLTVEHPQGGSLSATDTALHAAIASFLAESDPDAKLIPSLGYGFSDCHFMREAYGSVAYGFIPFRHADPMINLTTKHAVDERVLIDDLIFQTKAALFVAQSIGTACTSSRSS
jgi:acetylornithine deacetylase/succinyl-diaminopimelate desuccinylase-like protein